MCLASGSRLNMLVDRCRLPAAIAVEVSID